MPKLFKPFEFRKSKKVKKLPKFAVKKPSLIVLPDSPKNVSYNLIEPYASVKIEYDSKNKEYVYKIIEPKLDKSEQDLLETIIKGLLEVVDVELSAIKKTDILDYIETKVKEVINEYNLKISGKKYLKLMYFIYRNFIGLNRIEPLMQDPYLEDVSCDGVGIPLYIVHRKYGSLKTNIIYEDEKKLKEFVVKLAERCGRFISYAEPLLDGSLPDGSRVQASIAKDVTTRGPSFTVRKFVVEPFSPINLLDNKTVNSEGLAYLWLAVESGASILVSGGAGTGKTTFLNVLSMFIPSATKVISVEDTRELRLPHENWTPSVARPGFAKGYGEVTMFDLLKEGFRQSPDYVIVGEVRGKEAYVMFQGLAAGMPAMGTMHAGNVEDVIHRLETPPINLSPSLLETLDLVVIMVHARERGESARRVKEIYEIESVDKNTGKVRTNRVFKWLASEDSFELKEYSWLLQEISKLKGIPVDKLEKEIGNRKAVLEGLQKKKITNFEKVNKVLDEYVKEPQKVLKRFSQTD